MNLHRSALETSLSNQSQRIVKIDTMNHEPGVREAHLFLALFIGLPSRYVYQHLSNLCNLRVWGEGMVVATH